MVSTRASHWPTPSPTTSSPSYPSPSSAHIRSSPPGSRSARHAKLNLFLRVLAREAGGMHGIETLFCRIDLADELLIERAERGITLDVVGADLGPAEKNLAWRAADAVLAATGHRFGVRMQLTK